MAGANCKLLYAWHMKVPPECYLQFGGKRQKHDLVREIPSVFMNGSEVYDGGGASLQVQSEEQTDPPGFIGSSAPQEQVEEGEKGVELLGEEQWVRATDAQEPNTEEPGDGQKEGEIMGSESAMAKGNIWEDKGKEVQEVWEAASPFLEDSGKAVEEKEEGMRQLEKLGLVKDQGLEMEGQQQKRVTEVQTQEGVSAVGAGGLDSDQGEESVEANFGEHPQGASSAVLDLSALLSETNVPPWQSFAQPMHAGWHFPTGPGLGKVVHCPSWQFPDMSYYPQQEMMPFEVVWRVWENLSEPHIESEHLQGAGLDPQKLFEFTIMSYNILAQDLLEANQDLYQHCAPEVLAWEFRLQNILREFEQWDADILCLQEVQENHYIEQLHPALSNMGYACVYKRRTGTKTDGCAICYRQTLFSQLSLREVEYYRPQVEMLDRDNVGLVLLLQPISLQGSEVTALGPPLCVANTHLLYNPRRGDVKLAQLSILLAEIDLVVKRLWLKGTSCPIVVCGDFNSVPYMPLYNFITTQQLYYHGLPAWMISGQEDLSYKMQHRRLCAPLWPSTLGISDNCQYVCSGARDSGNLHYDHEFLLGLRFCEAALIRPKDMELIQGVTDATPEPTEKQIYIPRFRNTIQHGFKLRSAYSHFITETNRPEVTTLHSEFGATVDYIFYSSLSGGVGCLQHGGLKLIGRLALLSEEDLWPMKGLPNEIFSSDHLCLLAKFQLDPEHV
ncbi:hypothetical protein AGOR_G00106850 [Albula goreensis]|uniref:Endonuclease/exonuclease/phosphatase domain-containing protein n=1 Tax=Albula goreensis TaxID=1534307 RepID=A0A8T3DMM6_9TELE|nr:hypothetical protein AGOR_G00106850 [Albula goreensis]